MQALYVHTLFSWLSIYAGESFPTLDETELRLQYNNLTGTIPAWLLRTRFQILDLGHNQLTGTISDVSHRTQVLRLDGNKLSGQLPAKIGGWDLYGLDLSDNRLRSSS